MSAHNVSTTVKCTKLHYCRRQAVHRNKLYCGAVKQARGIVSLHITGCYEVIKNVIFWGCPVGVASWTLSQVMSVYKKEKRLILFQFFIFFVVVVLLFLLCGVGWLVLEVLLVSGLGYFCSNAASICGLTFSALYWCIPYTFPCKISVKLLLLKRLRSFPLLV